MQLTHAQIKSVTTGVCSLSVTENGDVRFLRMTERARQAFIREDADFGRKAFSSAGVCMDFSTDAKFVIFRFRDIRNTTSRDWFYFDLYVNGELYLHTGSPDNKDGDSCEFTACLDGKRNRLQLFFPFSVSPALCGVEVSDGAFVEPTRHQLRALCYGDSITHGYDSRLPSLSYVNVMARKLDCAVLNQAIGGARFNAEIVDDADGYQPDFITVAYGTNDWAHRSDAEFRQNADAFLQAVKKQWGTVPTFVILPIWRGDCDAFRPSGSFPACREIIKNFAEKYGFYVIDDFDLVPHFPEMFSPDLLHPVDPGALVYGARVAEFIKNKL